MWLTLLLWHIHTEQPTESLTFEISIRIPSSSRRSILPTDAVFLVPSLTMTCELLVHNCAITCLYEIGVIWLCWLAVDSTGHTLPWFSLSLARYVMFAWLALVPRWLIKVKSWRENNVNTTNFFRMPQLHSVLVADLICNDARERL